MLIVELVDDEYVEEQQLVLLEQVMGLVRFFGTAGPARRAGASPLK